MQVDPPGSSPDCLPPVLRHVCAGASSIPTAVIASFLFSSSAFEVSLNVTQNMDCETRGAVGIALAFELGSPRTDTTVVVSVRSALG